MNSLLKCCEQYLNELELYEDISNNKTFKKIFYNIGTMNENI
jgi:hypothetical protein